MIRCAMFGFVLLAACTKVGTGHETPPGEPTPVRDPVSQPGVKAPPVTPPTAPPPTTPPATAPTVKVEMTSVTLADDCGGTAPSSAPTPAPAKARAKAESKADMASEPYPGSAKGKRARRRCEQTSMQLSVTSPPGGAPTKVQIKSVQLFDDAGTSVGVLTASSPTRWAVDHGAYQPWDEMVAAGEDVAVSYVLSQPDWDRVAGRWDRTYTLKAIVTVGSGDQAVEHTAVNSAPTPLPPNVKT